MNRRTFALGLFSATSTLSVVAYAQNSADSEPITIIIPRDGGNNSRGPDRKIYQKHKIGWAKVMRESKMEWPGPTLRCRDRNAHVYAVIGGPENLIGGLENDVAQCCVTGALAAGIASIIASPGAAVPVFWAAFKPCMAIKLGNRVDQISVDLVVEEETTDWGRC